MSICMSSRDLRVMVSALGSQNATSSYRRVRSLTLLPRKFEHHWKKRYNKWMGIVPCFGGQGLRTRPAGLPILWDTRAQSHGYRSGHLPGFLPNVGRSGNGSNRQQPLNALRNVLACYGSHRQGRQPPSELIVCPVIHLASSMHSQPIRRAASSGSPHLPWGHMGSSS